jgi:prohibitin 1
VSFSYLQFKFKLFALILNCPIFRDTYIQAEGEKNAAIIQAEARKRMFEIEAEGKANAMGIEAIATRRANDTINKTLTPTILKLRQIEAFRSLSNSNNSKLIITDGKSPFLSLPDKF